MDIFTNQEVVDKPKMKVINQNLIKTKVTLKINQNGFNSRIRVCY